MKKKKKTKKKKSKVKVELTDDIVDDIKGFLIEEKPEKTKKIKSHYIDNKKFFSEMVEWKKQVKEAKLYQI